MLKQIFVIAAFLFILVGIVSGVVVVEKIASRQVNAVEKIIESANEID